MNRNFTAREVETGQIVFESKLRYLSESEAEIRAAFASTITANPINGLLHVTTSPCADNGVPLVGENFSFFYRKGHSLTVGEETIKGRFAYTLYGLSLSPVTRAYNFKLFPNDKAIQGNALQYAKPLFEKLGFDFDNLKQSPFYPACWWLDDLLIFLNNGGEWTVFSNKQLVKPKEKSSCLLTELL